MLAAQGIRTAGAATRPIATPRGRLAAVLVADVQGFCTLIRSDLSGTMARLQGMRDAVEPILAEHAGRLVKTTGDGFIAEFSSACEAVIAARLVQEALSAAAGGPALALRIGISLGEVVVDADGEIFGDAVNLAARIEPLAGAGGIVATSAVRDQLAGRPDLAFEDMGPHRLKGFEQPVAICRLATGVAAAARMDAAAGPSALAVLPLRAVAADAATALLADALSEELTTILARTPGLAVAARFSATACGTGADPARAAAALGVRFIVEGAIRPLGDRFHVNARLVDVRAGGTQVWSGTVEALASARDGVDPETARRLGARIAVEAMLAEVRSGGAAGPVGGDAWHRVRLAYVLLVQRGWSRETLLEAAAHCRAAIVLDADLPLAHGILALALALGPRFASPCPEDGCPSIEAARTALARAPRDPETLAFAGLALLLSGCADEGAAALRRAADLDPGHAPASAGLGLHLFAGGDWGTGLAHLRRGIAASPQDPRLALWRGLLAFALLTAERFDEALVEAHEAIEADPGSAPAWLALAVAWQGLDDAQAAAAALDRARRLQPDLSAAQAALWGSRAAAALVAAHGERGI